MGVAAHPARRDSAHPAAALRPRVRDRLDARGLAAAGELAGDRRCAGSAMDPLGAGSRDGGARHALRQPSNLRGVARAARGGRDPRRGAAALPPVLGHHRGLHVRRRGPRAVRLAPGAGAALHRPLPRRPRLHRRARRVHRGRVVRRRTAGPAAVLVPRPAAALPRRRRPVPLRMPQDRAARRRDARARTGTMARRVPVAGRAGGMAAPLHRRDARRVGARRRRKSRCRLPRLPGRLSGDAGGDRDSRLRVLRRRGRRAASLHPGPQRGPRARRGTRGARRTHDVRLARGPRRRRSGAASNAPPGRWRSARPAEYAAPRAGSSSEAMPRRRPRCTPSRIHAIVRRHVPCASCAATR